MRWLFGRYRHWLELVGYTYPPSYMVIADGGLMLLCALATVQRVFTGLAGWDWAILAGAICFILAPVAHGLIECRRPALFMLPVTIIASVALFMALPVRGDVAPVMLGLGATMSTAVCDRKGAVAYTLAYAVPAAATMVVGPPEQGWLYVIMVGFGASVGRLLLKQLDLLQAQRREHDQQAALERASIAGEVHDVVAHSLSIVLLNVTAARRALQSLTVRVHAGEGDLGSSVQAAIDPDLADAVDALGDAEKQGRHAMEDVRRTIELLRSDAGPTTPQPGLADLPELVDGFRRAGSTITFDNCAPAEPLSSATELAVFRVVQESLSNAAKHAAGAPVAVRVGPVGDHGFTVRVDNPVPPGTRRSSGGFGLPGMASRVENLDGRLRTRMWGGIWSVEAEFGPPAVSTERGGLSCRVLGAMEETMSGGVPDAG